MHLRDPRLRQRPLPGMEDLEKPHERSNEEQITHAVDLALGTVADILYSLHPSLVGLAIVRMNEKICYRGLDVVISEYRSDNGPQE